MILLELVFDARSLRLKQMNEGGHCELQKCSELTRSPILRSIDSFPSLVIEYRYKWILTSRVNKELGYVDRKNKTCCLPIPLHQQRLGRDTPEGNANELPYDPFEHSTVNADLTGTSASPFGSPDPTQGIALVPVDRAPF